MDTNNSCRLNRDLAGRGRDCRRLSGILAVMACAALVLTGCGGPKAGTVYMPSEQEESLTIDLTAEEARERDNKDLPEARIVETGYSITEIDESDVYPREKTDEAGDPLPAYLVNYAVRISNRESDRAMIRPTIIAEAVDMNGEKISGSRKTVRTYVPAGEEIAVAGDMTVRGQRPSGMRFYAEAGDPDAFYPTQEELDFPGGDSYSASEVTVEVFEEYRDQAPSAGRESSEGLSAGYFRLGELPTLSGKISCSSPEDQEAFVTILFKKGDEILGGETGRVMIPAGKEAFYTFSAAGPIPGGTDNYEVSAFSIAKY